MTTQSDANKHNKHPTTRGDKFKHKSNKTRHAKRTTRAAKKTSELIPLCHNINIENIDIDIESNKKKLSIIVKATVESSGKTGVEMEALTAVSVSCLTIYDMCKSLDKSIIIKNIRLISKRGGKSDFNNK